MKLWGGRFRKKAAPELERLGRSLDFDRRLGAQEIRINRAYARALLKAGRLTESDYRSLQNGLDIVGRRLQEDPPPFCPSDEDIHTAVERLLGETAGSVAGKLPAGRSR
ncbi:MAG: lyase family protein, partial [Acidobacteriota bacterium]